MTVTFASLSLPAQSALSWVVNIGGRPWHDDWAALHGIAARGYAVRHDDGTWTATDAGRALLPEHRHAHPEETTQ